MVPSAYNHGLARILYGQSMVMEMIGYEIYVNLILLDFADVARAIRTT